ncbi:MAG TPA: enoyl-CoA hydratase-related protein [Candidatus Saccharimonadia bacterium]|nr:enoyl-CoA hydratase-related protein [Candidatus Saccharimonadia bacterium]
MDFHNLLVSDDGAIRTITLNRPEKLNALNRATITELHAAFDAARSDEAVRVVVLTGAGPKAFVAGADIGELAASTPVEALAFSRHGQQLMTKIERLGKPVIASISGFALGGGMELAMACHLRIASDTAKLGQPEINLGVPPGFGGTQRLLRLAGRSAVLELCLLGAPIGAQRAYELGAVTRVVPADQLADETRKLAAQLAASAPHALRGILDAIVLGGEAPIDVGLDYESQAFAVCVATDDMREGTKAFLEKRKATFAGR